MKIDRGTVMRRAWKDFRWWRAHGEPRTFGDCLRNAWAVARVARASGSTKYVRAA